MIDWWMNRSDKGWTEGEAGTELHIVTIKSLELRLSWANSICKFSQLPIPVCMEKVITYPFLSALSLLLSFSLSLSLSLPLSLSRSRPLCRFLSRSLLRLLRLLRLLLLRLLRLLRRLRLPLLLRERLWCECDLRRWNMTKFVADNSVIMQQTWLKKLFLWRRSETLVSCTHARLIILAPWSLVPKQVVSLCHVYQHFICLKLNHFPISSDKEIFSYVKYSHRKQKKEKQNNKAVFTVVENILKMYCIKGIFQKGV